MLSFAKKNKQVHVVYHSVDFISGRSDIICTVIDENNIQVLGSPFTMIEINFLGIYEAVFNPLSEGTFKIIISETDIRVAANTVEITKYDMDSLGQAVSGITPPSTSQGGYIP